MKVLVTGGTGFIGASLCSELSARDHQVTALSRSPDDEAVPEAVETVSGDVTDYASIEGAFAGQDAVVNLVALSPLYSPKGGNRRHDIVHRGGTENCVRAAREHDVNRFVQQSGVHADPDGPTAYLRSKGRAEEIVTDSGLDWVTVRPTVVFGDNGEFIPFVKRVAPPYVTPLPGGGRTTFQPIWVDDLVPMLADAVDVDDHVGELYEIGGPDQLTLAEIARLIHAANGRSSTVIPIPMSLAGIGMTLGGIVPGFPFGPDQYRSLKLDLTVDENDIDAFGVSSEDLRSFHDYLGVQ